MLPAAIVLFAVADARVFKWTGADEENPNMWRYPKNWCPPDYTGPTGNCPDNSGGPIPDSPGDDVIIDYSNGADISSCDLDDKIPGHQFNITLKSIKCLPGGTTLNIKVMNVWLVEGLTAQGCDGVVVDLGGVRELRAAYINATANPGNPLNIKSGVMVAPINSYAGGNVLISTQNPKYFQQSATVLTGGTIQFDNMPANRGRAGPAGASELHFTGNAGINNVDGILKFTGTTITRLYGGSGQLTGKSVQFEVSATGYHEFTTMKVTVQNLLVMDGGNVNILSGGTIAQATVNGALISRAIATGGMVFTDVLGHGALTAGRGDNQQQTIFKIMNSLSGLTALNLDALATEGGSGDIVEIHGQNSIGAVTFTGPARLTIPTSDNSHLTVGTLLITKDAAARLKGVFDVTTLKLDSIALCFFEDDSVVTITGLLDHSTKAGFLQLGDTYGRRSGATMRLLSGAKMALQKPLVIDSRTPLRSTSKLIADGTLDINIAAEDPAYGFSVTMTNIKIQSASGQNLTGLTANVKSGHFSVANTELTAKSVSLYSAQSYFDGKQCDLSIDDVAVGNGVSNSHVTLNVSNMLVQCIGDCGKLIGNTTSMFNFSLTANIVPPPPPVPVPMPPNYVPPPPVNPPPVPVAPGGNGGGGGNSAIGWIVGIIIGLVIGAVGGVLGMYFYTRRAGYSDVGGDYKQQL